MKQKSLQSNLKNQVEVWNRLILNAESFNNNKMVCHMQDHIRVSSPRLLPKESFREPFGLPKSKVRSPTYISSSAELVNYLFYLHHIIKENPSPSQCCLSFSFCNQYPSTNCFWTTNISFLLLVSCKSSMACVCS